MTQSEMEAFVRRAEQAYATRLQRLLEPEHRDEFVAIEPESGEYFLGKTLSEAIGAARRSHPGRLAHAMQIGRPTALCFRADTRLLNRR